MLEIVIENFGNKIAIGLKGLKDEIENFFYSCWLHKLCNGELKFLTDTFAYFWSTPSRYITGLTNWEHHKICMKTGIEFEGDSLVNKLKQQSEEKLKDLLENHSETFLGTDKPIFDEYGFKFSTTNSSISHYGCGKIWPKKLE